ncbi:multiple monosaccharide ABC transporter substrate-binding protein [Marinilactibacillus psychrotolerans]|uniref:Multiple monosaccharide ABC transporter substrate-binding protein n=1 Tax=Marinilactibacillus psychrotolerans TaxID=191770 RepID=A0ABW8UJQ9_9LACT|nr:multiple monosaccharide ABC transporter substrate-binding protein [Marinilactibacillus psychrotolerans]GEQ34268.1 multiple sugar-binding periplasmic protein SbpA [Marinilactibacillus psychrotolerans]
MKIILLSILALFLGGCDIAIGPDVQANPDKPTIGISMPTQSSERWVEDGSNMVRLLEEKGYETDLQYGEDIVENQLSQIENMITKGADLLIIASIDGEALSGILDQTDRLDIPVISYDRLIMNSEQISYYATFDNYGVGELQAQYIIDRLGLEEGEGPFNIELFAGSPDDNNAYFFWDGAMDKLQPYLDSGQLVVQSGQTEFSQAATLRWDGATAQARMDNILTAHYANQKLDAILSPYDGISLGVISSLQASGYGTENRPLPIITGQDAFAASAKSIMNDEQTQTIFKDTRLLAERAVDMTEAIINGTEPEINDTETYDNNAKIVPSYLIDPVSVDKENLEEVLIESGYLDPSTIE